MTNDNLSTTSDSNPISVSTIQLQLINFIIQQLLPPNCGIELQPDSDLLSIGYLDSMQFMRLVQFSEENYSIKIAPEDLIIENFQTVNLLSNYLLERLN